MHGGPESLVVDSAGGRAYTHQWKARTDSIDLTSHKVVSIWENGCIGSRGIALDEKRGFLFSGCDEGKATVLDVLHGGKLLGTLKTDQDGVDIIDFNPSLSHLYVPAESGELTIIAVSEKGGLQLLARLPAAKDAHCVVADDRSNIYVCDPGSGRLLVYRDTY